MRKCVYCNKEIDEEWDSVGDLCELHWFHFRYGVILDEDPKFDIVEKEYHRELERFE